MPDSAAAAIPAKDMVVCVRIRPLTIPDDLQTPTPLLSSFGAAGEALTEATSTAASSPEAAPDEEQPLIDPSAAYTAIEDPLPSEAPPSASRKNIQQVVAVTEPYRTVRGKPGARRFPFSVDAAFDDAASDEAIYQACVRNLVWCAVGGGVSTIFAYGQTGSGKTYTMTGMEERVARDVFHISENWAAELGGIGAGSAPAQFEIDVAFFEIFGQDAFDLLNERQEIKILEDRFGQTQYHGLSRHRVAGTDQLLALIHRAAAFRKTQATARNPTSSRSHAVCRLTFRNTKYLESEPGVLCLVDLAGSEGKEDRRAHSAARLRETQEIHKSLLALKECIRNRAISVDPASKTFVHIPYRSSRLTMVLKEVFELTTTRTCRSAVIACISPHGQDIKHTLDTLRYTESIISTKVATKTTAASSKVPYDAGNPATWTNAEFIAWVSTKAPTLNAGVFCSTDSGLQMCRIPETVFIERAIHASSVEPNGRPVWTEKRARNFYLKIWSMVVDARTKERKKKTKSAVTPQMLKDKDFRWNELLSKGNITDEDLE